MEILFVAVLSSRNIYKVLPDKSICIVLLYSKGRCGYIHSIPICQAVLLRIHWWVRHCNPFMHKPYGMRERLCEAIKLKYEK